MPEPRVLLIVGGGVAAYKSLETVRRLADRGVTSQTVMTAAAEAFVRPLAFASLTGQTVHTHLFELTAEVEMGHIELSRSADLILVAPATADLMAKMANGLANDLASTLLLATDAPVMIAPAMNVRMWTHPATQRNLAQLRADGVLIVGPNDGAMACGEFGPGRMAEPLEIVEAVMAQLSRRRRGADGQVAAEDAGPETAFAPAAAGAAELGPLTGLRALVTSGPTHEPIDPVRYIANRSSGRQGAAIAEALARAGADVAFVTGPAEAASPRGCRLIPVETARDMRAAALDALPADIAVFAAAVADWRVAASAEKIKKDGGGPPQLTLAENPDILAEIAQLEPARRPRLVVGFAAETERVLEHARAKRARKGCDWIVANDVSLNSGAAGGVMGGAENEAHLITENGETFWPRADKAEIAGRLVQRIAREAAAWPRQSEAGAGDGASAGPEGAA